MMAANTAQETCVKALLQAKADPDLQNNDGWTALMAAADTAAHKTCVKALLRAKANTELLSNYGRTALQCAEAKGHTSIAKLIRQHAPAPPTAAVAPQATQAEHTLRRRRGRTRR